MQYFLWLFFNSDGVQKYNKCYIIETFQSRIGYKEGNCGEKHQFICKQDIGIEIYFISFYFETEKCLIGFLSNNNNAYTLLHCTCINNKQ